MSIGEAGKRFGLAVSTLRYWEERGLIQPSSRRSGRRWYGPDQLHRIGLIQMWQGTGLMSLEEIAALFAGTAQDHNWRATVLDRIHAIDDQMRRLAAGKAHLEHLLTCPQDDPAAGCPYLREVTTERLAGNPITVEELHQREAHQRHPAAARRTAGTG